MNRPTKLVLVGGLLIAGAVAAASLGLTRRLVGGMGRWAAPWRADLAATGTAPADPILQERCILLEAENAGLRQRLGEYEEVASALGLDPAAEPGVRIRTVRTAILVRARVLARSRPSHRYLEIDAGVEDGVIRDLAVCAGWSLIGVVVGEQSGSSLVRLVSDAESRIPATLIRPGRDGAPGEVVAMGVCAGTGKMDELRLDFVEEREGVVVEPGYQVVTAGGRGQVPPGLVLGTVIRADHGAESDHWSITLRPVRRGEAVSTVLVMKGTAGGG